MTTSAYQEIIDGRIEAASSELSEIDAQIQALQQKKPVVLGKLEELQAIKAAAGSAESSEKSSHGQHAQSRNGVLRPSKAVEQLLTKNPDGLTSAEIAKLIIDKIKTKSKDRKATIHSTLYTMQTAGKITKSKAGVYQINTDS